MCLDCDSGVAFVRFRLRFPLKKKKNFEKHISHGILSVSGSRALCMGPTTSLTSEIFIEMCLSVGPVHCLWDPQTSFFNKTFIKNGPHSTIHTFKNYFVTMFLVFNFQ